ncbi:MAG: GumC family protein [Xenococcaceae cyanobacterium]
MSNLVPIDRGIKQNNVSLSNNNIEVRESLDLDFTSYFQKLKRRWKPALFIFLLTVGATAALSTLLKITYQAEGKLLFRENNTSSLANIGEGVGELKPLLNNQTPLSTEIEVITSNPILQETIDQLKLENEEGEPLSPQDLENNLEVKIIGGSDVIQIAYNNSDPVTAAEIVNTLMNIYIAKQISGNQEETSGAREFISDQIPQVENKALRAESQLRQFKEANNIVDLAKERETLVQELSNINQQLAATSSQFQGVQAQAKTLQNQLGLTLKQAISANQLGNSPVVEGIFRELSNTESELAQERQRFRDNHPSIIGLKEKKADLNQKLRQLVRQRVGSGVKINDGLLRNNNNRESQLEKFISLEIEKLSLQRQLASLYQSQQIYLGRAKQLPRLEQKEKDLVRQVTAAQTTYETLLGSLQEVQLAENLQTVNAKIIELAQSPEQGSSGQLGLIVLGVLLGLLFSNLSVIFLEMQDRTIKNVPEIKEKFAYSVLGIIPEESAENNLGVIVQRQPDSLSSELYRMIQVNLKFINSYKQPQVILVTSSVPGEGKSTVSANLAAAIAQMGRRVLLIDGDLRKPSQHKLWQLDNQMGLKDVLTQKTNIDQVVSQPMEKLAVLTSGVIPPNPLALLDSPEMSNLITQAQQEYDLILIDAPPLPVTADVLTLSKMAEGILFVTRPGVAEQESAILATETLATVDKKVLGMVINGVQRKEFERYSYHARYAQSYFSRGQNYFDNSPEAAIV